MTATASPALPVVEASSVTRRYGHAGAPPGGVTGATLRVRAGEIVGVCGPSGAGKSTLLRLLAGMERPDHGTVTYQGTPAWARSRWRGQRHARYPRPGYVMPIYQDPYASLDPRWPIWRTVTEPLLPVAVAGASPPPARRAAAAGHRDTVRALLSRSGMDHVDVDARPGELSGGQCQRIAILRALIARPSLIVADEPTARQDAITAAAMTGQLAETAAAGTAIIVVSHNTPWLQSFATRVIELTGGRLRPGGEPPSVTAEETS